MRTSLRASLLLLLSMAPAFPAAAATEYTLGAYCQMLLQMQTRYSGNATARESLAADHRTYCADLDWTSNAHARYEGPVNPYISSNPDNVKGSVEIQQLVDNTAAQRTILEKYRAARESASQLMTECHARSARAFEAPKSDAADVLALLSGTPVESRINAGCNRIGGFEAGAEVAQQNARSQCQRLQEQCRSMVNSVDEYYRELRGTASFTEEMQVARSVAHNACNVMVDSALAQGLDVPRLRADLEGACADARRRLAAQPPQAPAPTPTPGAPPANEPNGGQNENFWTQAARVLPQALSLLNAATSEPAMDLATGEPLPAGVSAPAYAAANEGAMAVGAVKGDDLTGGVDRSFNDPLLMGDGLEDPLAAPGRRSTTSTMPQQASGAGGTPGALSGGAGAGAGADARRRGPPAKSRFATDVYAGALGAGGARAGRVGAGGYPEAPGARGVRGTRGDGAPAIGVAEMNSRFQAGLRRFLPRAGGARQPTAAQATGPDGITGPHSNLFWKISSRYQLVPLTLSPPASSK